MNDLRIVLADDHEIVRGGLRALLHATPGLTVIAEAANGLEAVEHAKTLAPDIVVMDVSMPLLDGVAATALITAECPATHVIALTAHDDRAHVARLLEAGAAGYVLKRAAADDLVRAIRAIAAGGTWVDPELAAGLLRQPAGRGELAPHATELSEREEEVLRQIAWGQSNKEIAHQLGISTKTVETYKARITQKLGLHSRTAMVRYAVQRGWLTEG